MNRKKSTFKIVMQIFPIVKPLLEKLGITNLQTATVDLDTKNAIRMQKKRRKKI